MICPDCKRRHRTAVALEAAAKRGMFKCPVGGERFVRAGRGLRKVSP